MTNKSLQYNFDVKELIPQYKFIGKEKDIESHILDNIKDISIHCSWGKVKKVERQYIIGTYKGHIIVDIMIWHNDGTGTAIEVKTGKTNRNDGFAAIGQCLYYGIKMQRSLKEMPRMVIAMPEINYDIYEIINYFKLPISLLMVDGDRCIYLT